MATINFLYRSKKKTSVLIIRLLYRYGEIDYVHGASTKLHVTKEYWDKEHKCNRLKNIDKINRKASIINEIAKITNHVLESFNVVNPDKIDKMWLQKCLAQYYNPQEDRNTLPTGLLNYFDFFLISKQNEITKSSLKKYSVVRNVLCKFDLSLIKPLKLIDVDLYFKRDFERYCIHLKYSKNTIAWILRSIKTVCNHAKLNGLETSNQLSHLKTKSVKVAKIFLSFKELQSIERIESHLLTESLKNARDWLIISCYTGQRVSDFMRYSSDSIRVEDKGPLLEFTQHKTKKIMTIPLHDKVLEILGTRLGQFPRTISSQKYNYYIKEVCKIAGINEVIKANKRKKIEVDSKFPYRNESGNFEKWKLVSSHIGRRSFATNFYGKIPTSYLTYMTGHSTERMFLNYIGKSNKDIALEMFDYFKNISWT